MAGDPSAVMVPPITMTVSPSVRNVDKSGEIAQRWMEMVLGEKFQSEFPVLLRSGQLLCDLVNKVYKALGMKSTISESQERDLRGDEVSTAIASATSTSTEVMRQNECVWHKVQAYLSACVTLGVDPEDMFQPEDLLEFGNVEKVYRNILALQSVAVALSNRRSIDERSSLGAWTKTDFSPLSEKGIFGDDNDDEHEMMLTADLLRQTSWQRLLFEYEQQQMRKAQSQEDENNDFSLLVGMEEQGQLKYGLWSTEERIRALLLRDDRDFGYVPDDLHGRLWMLTSGADMEMQAHKGQYQRLLAMEVESTEATRQIDVDLHRTLSDIDKQSWSEERTAMMRRILVAYAFYNPTLGYCQGLNYIVARILQFVDEEEGFYLLIKLIRLVPEDYYTTMLGLAVDQHVFADLVRLQHPEVAEHLTELGGSGMELSLACTEWFLTLFASPCDKHMTVRIWDSIFLFGDEVLFRVALALMQQEKEALLASKTYGDMLKLLNELGRENTNTATLMKLSREQDCVNSDRIDDFRAHHRLQLASGIVASSVDADDSQRASSERPSEGKTESKLKIFGNKKRSSIFKPQDRHAGRNARTFDRYITEEYSESLQKAHLNFTIYYDGVPPTVKDGYWGSAESYNQWGGKNVLHITGPEDDEKQSDATCPVLIDANVTVLSGGITSSGKIRERRSKSTAFISTKKNESGSSASSPQTRPSKVADDDIHSFGRSPRNWIQRFEDWHKEKKIQKEKKKAEKLRHKPGQLADSFYRNSRSTPATRSMSSGRRNRKSTSTSPHSQQKKNLDGSRGGSLKLTNGSSSSLGTESRKDLSEVHLSRSMSDPFHSPHDILRPSSWKDPLRKIFSDEMLIKPQHPPPDELQLDIKGLNRESEQQKSDENDRDDSRPRSDHASTVSSSIYSFPNSASYEHLRNEDYGGSVLRRPASSQDLRSYSMVNGLSNVLVPLVHDRSQSADFIDEDYSNMLKPFEHHPEMRRNVSVPGGRHHIAISRRLRHGRRMNPENARVIRDRADVVSYLHRKASDASSVAGSIPRSPMDLGRLSGSSSDSSRFGEQIIGSNRSGKSAPFRKSSFSFFEKLSSDLESRADDLMSSGYLEDELKDAIAAKSTESAVKENQ